MTNGTHTDETEVEAGNSTIATRQIRSPAAVRRER